MWKIFSVPCGSALYKFHCIYVIVQFGVCRISTCILCSVHYTPCWNMFEVLYLYVLQILRAVVSVIYYKIRETIV
jgi:hypothetical protein